MIITGIGVSEYPFDDRNVDVSLDVRTNADEFKFLSDIMNSYAKVELVSEADRNVTLYRRGCLNINSENLTISNIQYNEKKGVLTVIFTDGTVILKKVSEGDTFDLRTGVALAIVEKMYGSKGAFRREVKRLDDNFNKKLEKKAKAEEKKKLKQEVNLKPAKKPAARKK